MEAVDLNLREEQMEEKKMRRWRERVERWTREKAKDGACSIRELHGEDEEEVGGAAEEDVKVGRGRTSEEEEEDSSSSSSDGEEDAEDDEDAEDAPELLHQDQFATRFFRTLRSFRTSSLLADLTLTTQDGGSFRVHAAVLAAVSDLVRAELRREAGLRRGTLTFGGEVRGRGLRVLLDFAYTGAPPPPDRDVLDQVAAAARALGVRRLLEACRDQEEEEPAWEEKNGEEETRRLKVLQLMRSRRLGCDVILETPDGHAHAHRVVLAASSDYFRAMFTSGMKESRQPRVRLPFLRAAELEALIGCSYSGAAALGWSCVFEVAGAALQLQHRPALSLTLRFLRQRISPASCLDVAAFAEAYGLDELRRFADDFVLRGFQKVAPTRKFRDLPAPQLLRYLRSRSLCVPSELAVFNAVASWVRAQPRERWKLAGELLQTVHFPLMTFQEFKAVRCDALWARRRLAPLYKKILDDFCSGDAAPQSCCCRVYLPKETLVLVGGERISEDLSTRGVSGELWFGNSLQNHTGIKKDVDWRRLGEMPAPPRFAHEVAVLEGRLYVFGGKKYYGVGDTLDSTYRFDPQRDSWERCAAMNQKRSSFAAAVLNGSVYAIGGHCDPDYLDGVERYCPSADAWSPVRPLDSPLGGHAAKVLAGRIYVSGGLSAADCCLAGVFTYHPETGAVPLAAMSRPRARHCMEALGDRLYVAGGITVDDGGRALDQMACEVYAPDADAWTAFAPLPVPHTGAGGAASEGKFYVLGGYSHVDYGETKMVHRYDPGVRRWENVGKMPGPNSDIRACVMCLPPHLRV